MPTYTYPGCECCPCRCDLCLGTAYDYMPSSIFLTHSNPTATCDFGTIELIAGCEDANQLWQNSPYTEVTVGGFTYRIYAQLRCDAIPALVMDIQRILPGNSCCNLTYASPDSNLTCDAEDGPSATFSNPGQGIACISLGGTYSCAQIFHPLGCPLFSDGSAFPKWTLSA